MFFPNTKFNFILIAFIVISVLQVTIIAYWKTAKYWTFVNILLLLIVLFWYAEYRFVKMARQEAAQIFNFSRDISSSTVTEERILQLPAIVQKWLHNSQVLNKTQTHVVRLQQKGEMRTKPNAAWLPFIATQYFNCTNASFVWMTKVRVFPKLYLYGRDKLVNAEGAMLIKLGALFSVVDEREKYEINTGTMLRYLAEICWFPSAALYDYIEWEAISDTSAKATLMIKNSTVSGIFNFSEQGEILSFETERFYGNPQEYRLEKWRIEMISYQKFSDRMIPNKAKVIWKLQEGDFHWLTLEITDIEFNSKELYQ